jgi:hypothetical protein
MGFWFVGGVGLQGQWERWAVSAKCPTGQDLGARLGEPGAQRGIKDLVLAMLRPTVDAIQVIKNGGISPDDIVLVGFDFCCGEEEALAEGIEDASVAQVPTKMAELGVDALVKAIRGETVPNLID